MTNREIKREDGRIEQVCEHGVGHPLVGQVWKGTWKKWMGIHGCDGCCAELRKKARK